MTKNKEIELSSVETTAYWWIKIIKNKVRKLVIWGTSDKNEIEFVKRFYNFTEIDWRNLYLELVNYITEDVNNYVPLGNIIDTDAFNQDTDKKGHNRINEELSKIMHCSIPDIRLASSSAKDSVIYTNLFGASVWYKSCGVADLSNKYPPTYILTGDEKELNFYNLVISTIAVIKERDKSFNSVSILRNSFCKEYKKVNKLEDDLKEIADRFNQAFHQASEKDIILGNFWKETYYVHFRDIDYIGLEEYMSTAEQYATVILEKSKQEEEKVYSKKLKSN